MMGAVIQLNCNYSQHRFGLDLVELDRGTRLWTSSSSGSSSGNRLCFLLVLHLDDALALITSSTLDKHLRRGELSTMRGTSPDKTALWHVTWHCMPEASRMPMTSLGLFSSTSSM